MFFLELFKVVWPSLILHMFILCGVFTLGWFFYTRVNKQVQFRLMVPVVFGFTASLLNAGHTFASAYQNKLLGDAQQVATQRAQAEQQKQAQAFAEMRTELLKNLDQLVQNPAAITPDAKQKFFQTFAPILENQENRGRVANSVFTAYACQKFFLQDALDSFKSRKFTKSDDRAKCEGYDGTFFGREKLITAEVAKSNDEVIKTVSNRQRLPSSDGKGQDVDEKKLQTSVDAQNRALDGLKELFK